MSDIPYDGFSTHQSMLVRAALAAGAMWPERPMLEMGCGYYSTPVLAQIAREFGIPLTVASSDAPWLERFGYLNHGEVETVLIAGDGWDRIRNRGPWGLVFVDNEEVVKDRVRHLILLHGKAGIVVMHDAEILEKRGGSWDEVLATWKHVYFDKRLSHWTVACSDKIDPSGWGV